MHTHEHMATHDDPHDGNLLSILPHHEAPLGREADQLGEHSFKIFWSMVVKDFVVFVIKLSGMDSRYLLSSFRYRSHGLLYVQVSIIFSPFLSLTIIHSPRNKNQDLGAAESR